MAREIDELTEDDRRIMRLYEEETSQIDWDDSDDAVMAFAREIHEGKESGPGAGDDSAEDSTVVAFKPRARTTFNRIIHSPAMGFSLAACLMIGVFAGQGLNPYLDLGVSPGYQDVVEDNKRLQKELNQTQTQLTRSLNPAGGTPTLASSSMLQISRALGGYDCASLTASMTEDLKVIVTGHVSSAADLRQLSDRLSQLDSQSAIVNDARVTGWPACEALSILYRKASATTDRSSLPFVRPYRHGLSYSASEKLVVEATATTRYAGYLYVDFIQQDGTVVHMLPGPDRKDNAVAPGERVLLGNGRQEFTIAPPFGEEMLVVTSSPKPLFDKPRPQIEKAEAYLKALRRALAATDGEASGAQVVSNYIFIKTGP